jgi:hypothetical protein
VIFVIRIRQLFGDSKIPILIIWYGIKVNLKISIGIVESLFGKLEPKETDISSVSETGHNEKEGEAD